LKTVVGKTYLNEFGAPLKSCAGGRIFAETIFNFPERNQKKRKKIFLTPFVSGSSNFPPT
jgi:hypothetical protein